MLTFHSTTGPHHATASTQAMRSPWLRPDGRGHRAVLPGARRQRTEAKEDSGAGLRQPVATCEAGVSGGESAVRGV